MLMKKLKLDCQGWELCPAAMKLLVSAVATVLSLTQALQNCIPMSHALSQ